uniref:ABC transporter permease n=1 Tax=Heterorhabditis bacteriophora TaxID=37862 RepID=A0A1I7WBW9_HETBA
MKDRRRIVRRLARILCGRRLPQTWNTVLVLLSIHMYLTVPVILAAGINEQMTGLLRPYRELQQRGILLGEIDDDLLDLFYENV